MAAPAAAAEFAIEQILRDDTLDALPAVLERLVTAFSGRCALAFQPGAGPPPVILAAHPAGAADDQVLLRQVGAQIPAPAGRAGRGSIQAPLESGAVGLSVLLACSAPVGGHCLCAIALVGDASHWGSETRAVLNAVATAVAAQIRHANDAADLAGQRALAQTLITGSPDPIIATAESPARFSLLAQLAPVGIVQTGADGRAIFVNDRWCAIAGVRASDALGSDWLDLVHAADRDRVARDLAAAARGGEMHTDCRLRSSGGADTWVKASAVALYAADGAVLGFLATFTDINDVKQAEADRERVLAAERTARRTLADQTERLNCLIANAIPGVLFTDERGQITHVNQSFATVFGTGPPDPLVGTAASDLVGRIKGQFADPDEFVRRTAEAISVRQPVAAAQMATTDGRTLECDYWPVVVGGRYRGDLWLAWDMTERKQLEDRRERLLKTEFDARQSAELTQRQLELQNEKLRELDEAKTIFLATVSHELRTPLTSIVSFSELMRAETQSLTADGSQFLDIIERNAHRLLHLVGDLLLLSRLESGAIPLDLTAVSIPQLTEEAARAAAAGAGKRGVTVHFSAEDGPLIQADRIRVAQVLDNLIANAVKFSRSNGLVRVDAIWDDLGCGWRIDVADTGIGIPPGEIGQLFGRFIRASNARTAGLPGTGLGLSIVKAITELHGGRVTVDSTLGSGTTFTVYLPAKTGADPESSR